MSELKDRIRKLWKDHSGCDIKKANDVSNELSKLAWVPISSDLGPKKGLAFATRFGDDDSVYQIYVNPNTPETTKTFLYMHEAGHILLSHLSLSKEQREMTISKLIGSWPKIKKYVDISGVDRTSGISDETIASNYARKVAHILMNVAMDFEVNSKMFEDNEWKAIRGLTDDAYVHSYIDSELSSDDDLKKIADEMIIPGKNLTEPCWPCDHDFPKGLHYQQYIDLIIEHIEDFMSDMADENGSLSEDGNGSSENGNGSSKKLSAEDIDKLYEENSDANNEKNIKDLNSSDNENNGSNHGKGRGTKKSNESVKLGHGEYSSKIAKFLEKELHVQEQKNARVDNMHNYNRRKFGELIVAKNKTSISYEKPNLYLLVDVSGSVDVKNLNTFISSVKKVSKNFGNKSKIIWWSTELCGESSFTKITDPTGSGGTNMASGIKYISENYLKPQDKLIIISDYEDNLRDWKEELSKVKSDVAGICWSDNKKYVEQVLPKKILPTLYVSL